MFKKGKHIDTRQRFTIKKFKIGAASVLIGTVFAGFGTHVQADELTVAEPTVTTLATTETGDTASTPVAEAVVTPETPVAEAVATPKTPVAEAVVTPETPVEAPAATTPVVAETPVEVEEKAVLETSAEVPTESPKEETTIVDDSAAFVSEKATTKPVVKVEKPTSSAMPRPANEGRSFTEGASFRADTTATPTVTDPMPDGYTVDTERLPEELQKFSDKSKDIVTFGIVQNDASKTYFSYILNKKTGIYEVVQFNPEGVEITRQTIPNNGTSTILYFDEGKTRLKAQFRAAEQGSSPLSLSLQTFETAEKAKEQNNANPLQSLAGRFSDGYVDKSSGERRFGLIEYYAPLVAYSDTSHTNLLTGTEIHPDVIQSGYTGETYTTRPFNQAGEAGENFDVLAPLNADGVLTTAAWKEKGQVEDVIIEQPYSRWVNKKQENGTLLRKIRYEIVDDEGSMKISVFFAEKPDGYDVKNPENGPEPNFKPAIAIKRETKESHTYTIGGNQWTVSSYEVEKGDVIVKPSISETGPYTGPFKSEHYTVYEDFVTESGYPPAEGRVYANNVLNIRNPFRRASDEIKYYYTQETAVVKFFDVTDGGKRDLNEDVTGINGKGESLIPSDQGANTAGQSVSDIIAEYEAKGYKVKVNGFDAKPTFNATTAEYPAYGTSVEDMKANEAARRETNKATVEITLEKVKGSVVVNFVDEAGNPIPGVDSVNAVTNSPIIDENTSTPNTYDVTAEAKQTITVGDKTYELVPTKNATRQDNGSFNVTDGRVPNATGTLAEGTTYVNYVYREVPKPQLAKLIFREVPSKTDTSTETELDADKFPLTVDQNVDGTAGGEITFTNIEEAKAKLAEAGYELVSDNFTGTNATYDNVDGNTQEFKILVTPKVTPITPEEPGKPGEPIDPNNPGPKWPTDKGVEDVKREITRTVTYVKKDGDVETPVEGESTNKVTYTRTGKINHVTGEVTWDAWTPKDGDKTLEGNPLPTVPGYTATEATKKVGEEAATEVTPNSTTENVDTTFESKDIVEKVVFTPTPVKQGTVTVNYEDEEGNVIKDPVVDTPTSPVGTEYNTEDNKPTEITDPETKKEYVLVKVKDGSDFEKGTVKEGETTVTYVYKEKPKGSVIVDYVDESGNPIKGIDAIGNPYYSGKVDTDKAYVGTAYNTDEDNKPSTITTADGKVYDYVKLQEGSATPTGEVVEGETKVTYVYKLREEPVKEGKVTVNYVDEDGNVIKDPVEDTPTSPEGTDYDTTDNKPTEIKNPKTGKEYELVKVKEDSAPEKGTVKEGETNVTYVYKEKAKGNVVVNYRIQGDENTPIQPPVNDTTDAYVGTDYNTSEHKTPTIQYNGKTYELVPDQQTPNETGQVTEGTTNVTYYYREVPPTPEAPKPQLAKLIFREVPSKTDTSTETELDANKFPLTVDQNVDGTAGGAITFTNIEEAKAKLAEAGYELVSDNFTGTNATYDNVDGNTQEFKILVTPKVTPITPEEPGKPGEPIDPNNPGPKWPTDKGVEDVKREITRTVTYVKKDGDVETPVEGESTNKVTYTRTGKINHVTGEVTWDAWTPKDGDKTLEGNPLPTVPGYTATEATKKVGEEAATEVTPNSTTENVDTTFESKDIVEKVIFTPNPVTPEAPKTGTVVIEYVDTKGNPIKTSVVDDKDVPVGTDYDTTDEDGKPST
ncbi:MucBP domain-containing protein, partial [Streptococcus suis]